MINKGKSSNSNSNSTSDSLFLVAEINTVLSLLLLLFVVVLFERQHCCYCYVQQQRQRQQLQYNNNNNYNNKGSFGIIIRKSRREELAFISSCATTKSLHTGCRSLRRILMMNNEEEHTITATKDTVQQQKEQEPTASITTTTLPTATTTTSTPIGWKQLKDIVQIAAEKDTIIDSNGIIWLEHINLIVGCKQLAHYFYVNFLGCTPDKSKSFHVNLGQQQFHLAEAVVATNEIPQCIYGSIGITVPNIQSIRQRIPDAINVLQNTQFCILMDTIHEQDKQSVENMLTVRCPWGNIFHIYSATDDFNTMSPLHSTDFSTNHDKQEQLSTVPKKMVQMHSVVGSTTSLSSTTTTTHMNIYSPYRMSVRGQSGIRYIEFKCSYNTSFMIGEFYKQMLHCTTVRSITISPITTCPNNNSNEHTATTTTAVNGITLSVGPGVHFVFIEESPNVSSLSSTSSSSSSSLLLQQKMIGVHVCIYINEFVASYNRLQNANNNDNDDTVNNDNTDNSHRNSTSNNGLIWTNPRFVHLDTCDTIQEAIDSRTFRFKDIISLNADVRNSDNINNINNTLYELEHETRSLNHGQFFKLLNYDPK